MRIVKASLMTPSALLALAMVLLCVFLMVFHKKINTTLWRVLCVVPLLLCVIHGLCYNFGKSWIYTLLLFGPMYLTALLMGLWQFTEGRVILCRVAAGVVLLASIINFVYIPTSSPTKTHLHCYTYQSWTDSFIKTVRTMEEEYPLSDWKGIDYDALLEEFVPRIQAAEREQDKVALGVALYDFSNRFYDGHIYLNLVDVNLAAEINNQLIGNDYGLSLISLDTGEVVAVAVEPGSAAETGGIHAGTVVTHWNGVAVQEAKYSFALPIRPPVAENEEPKRTMLLAGQGGETVTVTFLADDGQSKTVQLNRIGDYTARWNEAFNKFCHYEQEKNFSYKMISDSCGYLHIKDEGLNALETAYAWITGQAPFITKRVDSILTELQAQGMQTLIIDIRNNTGGHPQVSAAVASLFMSDTATYTWEPADSKQGGSKASLVVTGNGKWKDLPVVVLVNQKTVSSGDLLAQMLADCDNVTLMGMNPSNGSCQTTGGICFLADGHFAIYYPTWLDLDANGQPLIDTDASRETRIPLDVKIPVDAAMIQAIFVDGGRDYELGFALQWLENRN